MKREGYIFTPAPGSPEARAAEKAAQLALASHLNRLTGKPNP